MCLEITAIIKEIESRKNKGELTKKRFACAQCGKTWIELVGLIIAQKEGSENLCLRIGLESENCQICRFRPLECPECGSKDVYETTFAEEISEEAPFTFKGIRKVSRGSNIEST